MKFAFKAKDQQGLLKEGVVEAIDRNSASLILQKNDLIPLSIKEETQVSAVLKDVTRIWEGVSPKELVAFFRQFSILIEAKVPVTQSLTAIAEETDNSYFRLIIKEVKDDVDDGVTFSEALAKHPLVFSPLTINLIHAGEISGGLQQAVGSVADNLEKDYQLAAKIKGALIYPAFVIGVAAIVGFLVASFIVPRLTAILKGFDIDFPWYTLLIITVADFFEIYWWAVGLGILLALGGFIYYVRTPDGREELGIWMLRVPIVGRIAQYIYLARFTDNLGILLGGGIPVVRALEIVAKVVNNPVFRDVLLAAAEEVKRGGNMSSVFFQSPTIPRLTSQMTHIGEESGTLSTTLRNTAAFYTAEVDIQTNNLTKLIEPILIVILGLGVAVMVIGILLPIYSIAGQIK